MPSVLDEIICACLARVYVDHATRTDRLTCKLEHALPIRHSFFRLKRVPHFQTRDDLHSQHTPAYLPIYRLENASLESLSQKTKAGCRRVLIEGDLGTGKTLVCQRLLHEWAKAMQFFRHVNIDQPYITVAGEQEESARMHHKKDRVHKSQTCDTEASLAKLTNDSAQTVGKQYSSQAISDQIQRRQRRPWNLGAIGGDTPSGHLLEKDSNINLKANPKCKNNFPNKTVTKATTLYEELTDEMLTQEDYVGREMPTQEDYVGREMLTQEDYVGREMPTQEDYVGREMPTQEDYVGREMLTQTKIVGEDDHRSRKALFVQPIVLEQTSPCGSDRTDSRSKANSRKESRSRSSGELEKGNLKKKNNKAFDGIPQKYLSLLNMGSGGEGSFESPSRSKSVREARRQRPSRLTSNLTDYKAMIYIPCVRMSLSDLLTKCNNARVRHYYVAATVLLDLLTLSNVPHQPVPFDAVYHWVLANREDICVIFDNVDGSETWERLISDAFHDRDGFGKMIAATTPGRISKRDVDTLFYCYGLSTEYSNKILLSRLRTEAPQLIDRISFLLTSNHTQELLCNPLSLSLLAAYLRSVTVDDNIPEHLSELLENLIHHAMAHETNTGQNVSKGKRQRFSLQGVCETVAFECLENDTNYFSKQKFPQQFWMRHLCDCRVLHEVHEIANFASIHEKASSPPPNILITPDSDSVHSSTSSSFEVNLSSDLCASNQSLSSVDPDSSRSDTDGVSSRAALSSGILLQVPNIHNSTDNAKKNAERPKSLALDGRKSSQGKSLQTTQTSGEIVSFTSRCIRDFLASKRVCRYLQSDRDCESFIQRLIAKPQFYPVLRLTVRHLYISERSDLILNLLDMLLTSQELGFQDHFNLSASQSPRGPSPTTFGEPAIRVKIPHRYRVSNSDCPFRAKREDLKQRRSSTSILGTCFESSATLNTSPSFNRLLINTSSLSPFSTTPSPEATRGYLEDYKEALIWLAETDNSEPYIGTVSNRFPDILVIPCQDCPPETIDHFICLTKRSVPAVKEVVLYMSGLYTQWDLGIRLAEALHELSNLTVLRISMKCVVDTSFLVEFLCECFEKNGHIETLYLEGPMNVAENLTPNEHKRVQTIFSDRHVGLKTLVLDHFSYHHRIGYILASWPNFLDNLQIKKSSIDSAAEKVNEKLSLCPKLTSLTLENCYLPAGSLMSVVEHIYLNSSSLHLTSLELTTLSSARKFSKCDAKKSYFKPTITYEICQRLADIVRCSPTLKHLLLSYNGLSEEKARLLLQATPESPALSTLDLTGNIIGNGVQDDVLLVLSKSMKLKSLLLGDNGISKETRSVIIKKSLSRHDLRLSL